MQCKVNSLNELSITFATSPDKDDNNYDIYSIYICIIKLPPKTLYLIVLILTYTYLLTYLYLYDRRGLALGFESATSAGAEL